MNNASVKIALFSPALPDSGVSNGIVTYVRVMRDAFRSLGHSVIVLAGNQIEHANGRVSAVPVGNGVVGRIRRSLEARRSSDASDLWVRLSIMEAFRAARREGAQVFEIEESYGWAARLIGKGPAVVTRLHGPHVYGRDEVESPQQKKLGDLRESAELNAIRSVEAISCPSRRLLDAYLARYGLELPLARAIPNPIAVVDPNMAWRVDQADPNQILCVGRFDLRKGADLVVTAFAQALAVRPSLRLVMVGPDTGLMQADGTRVHFDDFVARNLAPGTGERIRFLGPQPHDRIAKLRLQSGFSVVGSRFENFPYSIAEAMAVGMPVLASDSFGNVEMIRDGVDGRIVSVGDIAGIRDAMISLASNPARLAEMGSAAYSKTADWLSPERVARETVSLYRTAIQRMSDVSRSRF